MTSRKPSAGFWITVALLAALVAYPLSFGPAWWMHVSLGKPGSTKAAILFVYMPLDRVTGRSPARMQYSYMKYCLWWMNLAEPSDRIGPEGP